MESKPTPVWIVRVRSNGDVRKSQSFLASADRRAEAARLRQIHCGLPDSARYQIEVLTKLTEHTAYAARTVLDLRCDQIVEWPDKGMLQLIGESKLN